MITPTIEELWKRKSVRAYTDRKITKEEKELILRSASEAASAGNQQMYTILDITDQKLKDTLTVTCDNQPFIAKADLVLVFCVDFQKWYDTFRITAAIPGSRRQAISFSRSGYGHRGSECGNGCRELRHRLLLYRRYFGAL